ncbi:uncharacterized protein LOC114473791 [Gouania willdenowi]|uniref:uncharacterized protein LOC114473791 n=1 Tax=Gouania willdenowi TaxID=441366 RepID=UPI001055E18E|nr:uncharacterized protein LOC114473791 [Gouania willdenowi]
MSSTLNGGRTRKGTGTGTLGHQDCYFFNQINFILEADDAVVKEQLFHLEQKECEDKARKFRQETNRHRRMIEERLKELDMKEKHRGEKILQRRREKIQDATNRFQRANRAPAQRRKPTIPAFSGKVTNQEDAKKQMRVSLNWFKPEPFLLSQKTIKASGLFPFKPATVSISHHRPRPSAVESNTDAVQVQEQNNVQPELDHSSQDIHQSDSESECCLSIDSLECEDDVCDSNEDQQVFSSSSMDSEEGSSDGHSQNQPTVDLAPGAGSTLFSGKTPTKGHKPGRGFRNPCTQSWPPGNRHHLTPQPINLNAQQLRPSNTYGSDFQNEGNGRAAQSHLADVEAQHTSESDLESVETQRQPHIDIFFEEQKVLRSLKILDHQLQYLRKRGVVPTPSCLQYCERCSRCCPITMRRVCE